MDVEERRRAADALRAIKRGGEGWYSLSDAVLGGPAPRDEVVARLATPVQHSIPSAIVELEDGQLGAVPVNKVRMLDSAELFGGYSFDERCE